jgi:transcriptional regulator with XRE-family HTH domain
MHRIRELREEKGLTQVRLAVAADMNPATLNRIEMGKANPNLKTLERLADALDITVSRLLEGDSPKAQAPPPLDLNSEGGGVGEAEIKAATQRVNTVAILAKDLAVLWTKELKALHEDRKTVDLYRLYEIQGAAIGYQTVFFNSLEVSERGAFTAAQRRKLLTLLSVIQVLSEVCRAAGRFAATSSAEGREDALAVLTEFAVPDIPETYRRDPHWGEALQEVRELVEKQAQSA